MKAGTASRTAVLTCQGRAVAPVLDDPTALALLREDERVVVHQVLAGRPPGSTAGRLEYELVRASGDVMAARTLAIDEAVRRRPAPQLVLLGAGLDGRPWRMPELAGRTVFAVDHPDSQDDLRGRLPGLAAAGLDRTAADLRLVAADLTRDRLDERLAAAGHDPALATVWVWEGVVVYLRAVDVRGTAERLAALSAPGSRLVLDYQIPSAQAWLGRLAAAGVVRLTGRRPVTAGEPRRSRWTPAAIGALVGGLGFTVADDRDLVQIAVEAGLPDTSRPHLRSTRVLVADRR